MNTQKAIVLKTGAGEKGKSPDAAVADTSQRGRQGNRKVNIVLRCSDIERKKEKGKTTATH